MKTKKKLINYYKTCNTDQYGQIRIIPVCLIAETEQERQDLEELVNISTYGGVGGTYKGFNPWSSFKDTKTADLCRNAFELNTNRP
jgi:hypothetical protein